MLGMLRYIGNHQGCHDMAQRFMGLGRTLKNLPRRILTFGSRTIQSNLYRGLLKIPSTKYGAFRPGPMQEI